MIIQQVSVLISCSSDKDGSGKNVLISAKMVTKELKLQRLKVSRLITFFTFRMYSLTSIMKEVTSCDRKTEYSPDPICKADTLLPS